jgi:hypothetical protein
MICPHCQKNTTLTYYQGSGYHPDILRDVLANKIHILDKLAEEGAFDAGVPASVRVPYEIKYREILADCAELERVLGL